MGESDGNVKISQSLNCVMGQVDNSANIFTDEVLYIGSTPRKMIIHGRKRWQCICQSMNYAMEQVVTATYLLMVQYTWTMWRVKFDTHLTMKWAM